MPEDTSVDGAMQATNVATEGSTSSSAIKAGDAAPFVQEPGNESGENGARQPSSDQNGQQKARESRYERTKRERAQFRAQQAEFQRARQAFAQERAAFEQSKKPQRDYTLADLKKYRNEWQAEGNYDLVSKADKEIAAMEAEAEAERAQRTIELPPVGTPEHTAAWQQAEKELFEADPEFMRTGTRLDGKLRAIMASEDGNIYRQHPRGIVAAYHRAKLELTEADLSDARTENSKLKHELQRLTGLTSIDGGALSKVGSGSDVPFERLSTKDMRKRLMQTAQRGSVPWF